VKGAIPSTSFLLFEEFGVSNEAESVVVKFVCSSCGNDTTRDATVDVTMHSDKGLVVIENVPARICTNCEEQYYEDWAAAKIRQLVSSGFPKSRIVREITVPVYTLEDE
jgi:HTH-type transcriptional regulator/antitoxin MqsA